MLLMVRAEAAIPGAAVLGPRLDGKRPVAGPEPVTLRFPIGQIVGDQRLLDAMRAASFLVKNIIALRDDLGGDESEAGFTQARGLAQKQICGDAARRASR